MQASSPGWIQAWSLDYFLMALIIGRVCSCRMQAWSSGCKPGHGMILFLMTLMAVARLFLLDASLVVGMQAWSLDYFIFNDVDRWARLFLLDASKPGSLDHII